MTTVVQTPFNEHTGNGVTTVFGFTFHLLDEDDLKVYVAGSLVADADYTVSGVGVQAGGSVTFDTAPADAAAVLLSRELALAREIDYQANGDLPSATIDEDVDRVWQALQQQDARLDGVLRAPYPETLDDMPAAATRASKFLYFDADGQPTAAAGTTEVPVSAFMATVLDDATAGAALTTLGVSAFAQTVLDDTTAGAALTTLGVSAFVQTVLDDADAAAVRTTLGAGAAGSSLFTAADAAAARAAAGFTSAVIDRTYASYATNASLTTQIPFDDTIPQNTEGTEIISVAFTPKSVTSRLRLRFSGPFTLSGNGTGIAAIFSSAGANALTARAKKVQVADESELLVIEHEYVPGTTSALTFTVRAGPASAITMRFNGLTSARVFGGAQAATLVIEEIAV